MHLRYAELTGNDLAARIDFFTAGLTTLLTELGDEGRTATKELLWDSVNNPRSTIQLAYDDDTGAVVGMLATHVVTLPDDREGRIDDVAVLAPYRRHGVGQALMERALELFSEMNVREVELTCAHHREAAARLYERLGFKERVTRVYTLTR